MALRGAAGPQALWESLCTSSRCYVQRGGVGGLQGLWVLGSPQTVDSETPGELWPAPVPAGHAHKAFKEGARPQARSVQLGKLHCPGPRLRRVSSCLVAL